MDFLREAIQLIVEPPGDLVYYLVTLFALQQVLTAALVSRSTLRGEAFSWRWMWAAIGMLIVRGVLIVVSLLSSAGITTSALTLVPLERWGEVVSILLVIWAAILSQRPSRWQTWGLALLLALTMGLAVYSLIEWPVWQAADYVFGDTSLGLMWEAASLGSLALALILCGVLRPIEWEWVVGACLFWLAGHVAQILFPDPALHISGWERLGILIAFPLLAMLAHRQLANPRMLKKSIGSLTDIIPLQNVIQTVESARELEPALIIASSRLAELLKVEMCAIALQTEASPPTVRVVAIHPPSAAQISPPELQLEEYPGLNQAYQTREMGVIPQDTPEPWLATLFSQLGMHRTAELFVLPLHQGGKAIGLILLADATRDRHWDAEAMAGLAAVASSLSSAITRAQLQRQENPLLRRLNAQDAERQKTQQGLEQAKEQVQALTAKVNTLAKELRTREQQIQLLNQELAKQGDKPTPTELAFWQHEVEGLVREREQLEARLSEATQGARAFQVESSRQQSELSEVKTRLEALTDDYQRLQAAAGSRQQLSLSDSDERYDPEGARSQNTGIGLVIADEDGQITMADALARRMLKLPEGDVTGIPINGAYPDPNWTRAVDQLLSNRSDNGAPGREFLTLSVDGVTVEAELASLRGRNGRTDGLAITLRSAENPSERHEALVGLTTELRTPMTAITGYTDLLLGEQAGILTEMQQQFLERIKANAEQMNHLVNDVVRVVTADNRAAALLLQPVNLIEIIEEAIMGLAARFRERRLAIRLDLPPEAALVQADRDSLYQIMLRLISNAVLCSREGTEIVISAREDKPDEDHGFVRISVIDTGGGISSEDYPRVFRRFYRANQPLVQGMGETGVGMAVAKTLVEANGGRIWVESQSGMGSTFSFVLPTQPQMIEA